MIDVVGGGGEAGGRNLKQKSWISNDFSENWTDGPRSAATACHGRRSWALVKRFSQGKNFLRGCEIHVSWSWLASRDVSAAFVVVPPLDHVGVMLLGRGSNRSSLTIERVSVHALAVHF
jgi:hypothetical protein